MRRLMFVAAALLLTCIPAVADTVTVSQTLTYADNHDSVWGPYDATGPFFVPRDTTLDHDYRRGAWQDWGWTHNLSSLVPADATGVTSATLKIQAWDVADKWAWDGEQDILCPEQDKIYVVRTLGGTPTTFKTTELSGEVTTISLPTTFLGDLAQTGEYQFGATSFTITDTGILNEIWSQGALKVFMNIDALFSLYAGHQVTLVYATLTVDYTVPHTPYEPNLPVYRFWDPVKLVHFFTTNETEKAKLLNPPYSNVWTYEGIAYYTYPDKRQDVAGAYPNVKPVYRFWSTVTGCHLFTMSETEKDQAMGWCTDQQAKGDGIPSTWTFEGIAYYAVPAPVAPSQPPAGSLPVYRFWSDRLRHHFYTMVETEKDKLLNPPFSDVWGYQGVVWYAFP